MAGYNSLFIRVLIRQAKASVENDDAENTGAKAFLNALITGHFTSAKSGETPLISSTVNGKTISFVPVPGMTKTDVMMAAELALQWLEAGHDGPVSEVYARFP